MILLCNGDSWTQGDSPSQTINWDSNESLDWYTIPHNFGNYHIASKAQQLKFYDSEVWPKVLGRNLKIDTIKAGRLGDDNQGITRRTIYLAEKYTALYDPSKILVVIGWSSPERKDFFYKWHENDAGEWECLYPGELDHWTSEREELLTFYKLYVKNHWYPEEFITRHCLNNISLHYFLKSLNIKHIFFNSFYENKEQVLDKNKHQLLESPKFSTFIEDFRNNSNTDTLKRLEIDNILAQYSRIHNNVFFKDTFLTYLLSIDTKEELVDFHPTEKGHELWAKHLSSYINDKFRR